MVPRGENDAFQERVGKLSKPLIVKDVRLKLRSLYPEMDVASVDLESYVDGELTFGENWEQVKKQLAVTDGLVPEDLEAELEKYRYLKEKYLERHELMPT